MSCQPEDFSHQSLVRTKAYVVSRFEEEKHWTQRVPRQWHPEHATAASISKM
jgi:hypothetical protein